MRNKFLITLVSIIAAATLFSCKKAKPLDPDTLEFERAKNTCHELWNEAFNLTQRKEDLLYKGLCHGYNLYEVNKDIKFLRGYIQKN